MSHRRTLFVGIGSPHGDDRIGWQVADALEHVELPNVELRQASTPSHVLDWLEGFDRLIVCDACLTESEGRPTGPQVHRWEWPTPRLSTVRSAGSHAFGLPQVLELAQRLHTLPSEVVVFGVEGSRFNAFAELSTEIAQSFDKIVGEIVNDLTVAEAVDHA